MAREDYLFVTSDLRSDLEGHERRMQEHVAKISPDEFLAMSPEALAESLIEEYRVKTPQLQHDQVTVDQRETTIDVSEYRGYDIRDRTRPNGVRGVEVSAYVPFQGDGNLFACTPSTRNSNPPKGELAGQEIILRYQRLDHDAGAVKAAIDHDLGSIQQYLGWIAADVRPFNDALPGKVRATIEHRRESLLADRGMVAALGYKLRERSGAPKTYTVPAKRKQPRLSHPSPGGVEPFRPEPALGMEQYEDILRILSSMVTVIERSPGAFARMKEEDLRQQFLVQLNGQYEGLAGGELFNDLPSPGRGHS